MMGAVRSAAKIRQGKTYYVAKTGSDSNPGTSAQPWLTIAFAVTRSFAHGDKVVVRPGTYTELVLIDQGGTNRGDFTLISETPRQALVRPTGGTYSTIAVRTNYVTVEGFDVVGGIGHAIEADGVHHVTMRNNLCHDSGGSGLSAAYSEFITIENNTAHTNAATNAFHCSGISIYQNRNITEDTTTPGYRAIVRNNICYNNIEGASITVDHTDGNGIIIDDFQSTQNVNFPNYTYPTLVENNLCYGNGSKGIQVTWSDSVTVRNNTVYHNNLDNLNLGTWRGELSNQQSSNNSWINNIAVANPSSNSSNTAIGSYSSNGYVNNGTIWNNNLTFNGSVGAASFKLDGGNSAPTAGNGNLLGANPLFVNAGVDFRLQAGSPARNAGTVAFGIPANDLDGNPRPVGTVDIGAYESAT